MILRPVLIAIPDDTHLCRPKRRQRQREYARMALRESARMSDAPLEGYLQDASDVPLPNAGFYWSISHTRGMAAGVVSREPVGIDVEALTPRREGLFDMVGSDQEWSILGGRTWENFFRLFTAKEATLKASGKGIGYLRECRLLRQVATDCMEMGFVEESMQVYGLAHLRHQAALATKGATAPWHLLSA
jgi:4'-phosphopantetheinyl transferase